MTDEQKNIVESAKKSMFRLRRDVPVVSKEALDRECKRSSERLATYTPEELQELTRKAREIIRKGSGK